VIFSFYFKDIYIFISCLFITFLSDLNHLTLSKTQNNMMLTNKGSEVGCNICGGRCQIFNDLTEKELDLLSLSHSEAKFKTGELIIKQGTPSNMVVLIVKGLVKVFIEGVEGKDLILSIVTPPRFLSGPELYYGKVHTYSVAALQPTECCYVEEQTFKQLIWDNRKFSDAFMHEFCRRSVSTLTLLVNSTQKKMHGRVAEGLLYLSQIFGSDTFNMVLTKKEFGDLTSMTRESALRILHQFKEEGIIELNGNFVSLLDKKKLINIGNIG
jgi:CRP/FNR family transcriptional regulator, polysaccharide utilization system transcription regulator